MMKPGEYILLFGISLGLTLAIASAIQVPGYMDAEYYYAVGMEITSGNGFSEPFLWNYLDDPAGLPHPAATYWMPLASLVSALGIFLSGKSDFFSARIVFLGLAGLVPVSTAWLAFKLTGRKVTAWTAGGLALFSGFYAVYLGLTETFAIYMLLGSGFLVVLSSRIQHLQKAFLLGLLAGLFHMARADGLLWLAIGGFYLAIEPKIFHLPAQSKKLAASLGILLAVYLCVMGLWYVRNMAMFGGLFPPGTNRALWLTDYDQLYNFPASTLTFQNWWAVGLPAILIARWNALLDNLQTLLAVQGGVFLMPLIATGIWRMRRTPVIWFGTLGWMATFLAMTLIFPLAGSRGGFLHSGAAFQSLFWIAGAEGLAGFVELGVRWRNWKFQRALIGFGILCVSVSGLVTLGLTAARIAPGDDNLSGGWNSGWEAYRQVDGALNRLSVPQEEVIMVNNPPGFFVTTGRPAIVIPNGGVDTALEAAKKFQAHYLVLEENSVMGLVALYRSPVDLPGLKYLESAGRAHLFQITHP